MIQIMQDKDMFSDNSNDEKGHITALAPYSVSKNSRRKNLRKAKSGRAALSNPANRFSHYASDYDAQAKNNKTQILTETTKQIVTKNNSPDIGFKKSINPYRGCEHGCIYCYARPNHAYMDLSSGLDFETQIFAKKNAAERLRAQFSKPNYKAETICIGTATDAYQPIEDECQITREILEVFLEFNHPVSITTKSSRILKDLDILRQLAQKNLIHVTMSITTLDSSLARIMEPRACTPQKRLDAIKTLSASAIPVSISLSPVIPAINDYEMEAILEAASIHGATCAHYIILRLPLDVKQLFSEWLAMHFPDRARHVLSILKSMHGEKLYDATFGTRMKGTGPYAKMLQNRFNRATKKFSLKKNSPLLSTQYFVPPVPSQTQLDLFEDITKTTLQDIQPEYTSSIAA